MRKRILIAEDDERLVESYERMLREHELTFVTDGSEALDSLSKETYDLLILDIVMPRVHGLETLDKMNEEGISVPTIVATSTVFTDASEHYSLSYPFIKRFLKKPFTVAELREAVSEVVGS